MGNKLNYEQLLIIKLMEEAAEIQQECSKILWFGMDDKYGERTNRERLEHELNDFEAIRRLLFSNGSIASFTKNQMDNKMGKVAKWLRYSDARGIYGTDEQIDRV